MAKPNRITASRPEDYSRTQLTDLILGNEITSTNRTIHLAQVIQSNDPLNANRLRVRIPLLDDVFYANDKGIPQPRIGDDKLPWAIPSSSRMIETPENGSVVIVALFDPQEPTLGRVWLTAVPELDGQDIFEPDRLTQELETNKWQNAEDSIEVAFNNSPEVRGRPSIPSPAGQTNYKTGIRGKDKNKLLFDRAKTTLIQNEGTSDESKVELTENVLVTGRELDLISTQSSERHTPLFADPTFDYLERLNDVVGDIVRIMNTIPSLWMGSVPNNPNPQAANVASKFAQVRARLAQLKNPGIGHSKFIDIN